MPRKQQRSPSWPPKGSYPHPDGGFILPPTRSADGRISIRGHVRADIDYEAIAKALIEIARQQLEKERRDSDNAA